MRNSEVRFVYGFISESQYVDIASPGRILFMFIRSSEFRFHALGESEQLTSSERTFAGNDQVEKRSASGRAVYRRGLPDGRQRDKGNLLAQLCDRALKIAMV